MSKFPDSYNHIRLSHIKFSHHPASSPTVTPVILLILNRPEARNAFTGEMCESLIKAYGVLSADPRVKCIVLTGADTQNRTFCAGLDLKSRATSSSATTTNRDDVGQMSLAMQNCAKPIIAAINGSAVGVGITMTLPANIRIVSRDAKVGFIFARRGLSMEACSSFYLPRIVGAGKALHLVTTGAVYPATHELYRDLFTEVVAPGEVIPRALELAEEIVANCSSVAVKMMKELICRGGSTPYEAHLLESALFWDLFTGKDAKEGVASFLEKRVPNFQATVDKDAPKAYPWWENDDARADAKMKSKI